MEFNRSELNFIRGEGFSNDEFTQVRNAAIIIRVRRPPTRRATWRRSSPGRSTSLDRKYGLGGSLRTDGSQPVRPQQPLGHVPGGVGVSWLLSEEPFLKGGFFDYFKLRGSYGLTGNQAISDYPFQGLVGSANYGDTPGHRAEQPGESRPQVGDDRRSSTWAWTWPSPGAG